MDKEKNQEIKCCLCNTKFTGYGHNPLPLYNSEGRACTFCNFAKVIPARLTLKDIKNGKNEKHLYNDGK